MTSTQPHRTAPGPARLYKMSAERALAAIPAGSISVLLTDPAYKSVNRQGGSGSHLQRWFPGGLSWTEIGRILAVARRKLRADGVAFVMTNGDGLHDALGALQRAGFARVRTVVWDRQYPGLGAACGTRRSSCWWACSPARAPWPASISSRSARSAQARPGAIRPRSLTSWGASWPGSHTSARATWCSTRSWAVARSWSVLANAARR